MNRAASFAAFFGRAIKANRLLAGDGEGKIQSSVEKVTELLRDAHDTGYASAEANKSTLERAFGRDFLRRFFNLK